MAKKTCAFFLGTNSKNGFVPMFYDAAAEDFGRESYYVKSGPGCGKATTIKRLAEHFYQDGIREDILCASAPDSLDGVILEQPPLSIMDGTAPHASDT